MADYESKTKAELLDIVKSRKAAGHDFDGIGSASAKDDIIAALELCDEAEAEHPLKKQATADGVTDRQVPSDLDQFTGQYKYLPTGEIFGLKVVSAHEVRAHKTHHAKSPMKFWDGTEKEFREHFEKL